MMNIEIEGLDAVIASLNATMQQFENDVDQIVQETAVECKNEARSVVQVDTGYCRDHIIDEHEHLESSTTSQAPYSASLEYGTRRSRPYPFMSPSFEIASEHMQEKMKQL
jgi:HK97 gp10 family phage protein